MAMLRNVAGPSLRQTDGSIVQMAVQVGGGSELAADRESIPEQRQEGVTYLIGLYQETRGIFHALTFGRHVLTNSPDDLLTPYDNVVHLNTGTNADLFVLDVLVKKTHSLWIVIVEGVCVADNRRCENSDDIIKLRLGGTLVLGGEDFMLSTRKDRGSPLLRNPAMRRLPSVPQTAATEPTAAQHPYSPPEQKPTSKSPFQIFSKSPFTRSYSFNMRRKLPIPPVDKAADTAKSNKFNFSFGHRFSFRNNSNRTPDHTSAHSQTTSPPGIALSRTMDCLTEATPEMEPKHTKSQVSNTLDTPKGQNHRGNASNNKMMNNVNLKPSHHSSPNLKAHSSSQDRLDRTLLPSTHRPVNSTTTVSTRGKRPEIDSNTAPLASEEKGEEDIDSGCHLMGPRSSSELSGLNRDSMSSYGDGSVTDLEVSRYPSSIVRANTWAPAHTELKHSKSLQFENSTSQTASTPPNTPPSPSEDSASLKKRYSVFGFSPCECSSMTLPPVRRDLYERRRLEIAKELCRTEERYVARLKLIAVDFRKAVKDLNSPRLHIPDTTVRSIFLNIEPIYRFHQELLTSLTAMLTQWDTGERLGLVLSELAPYLRLYVHYISKFDSATKTLTELAKKDKKFESALKKFESHPACCSLSVSHHMLEPVQRVPRYRLLLLDYLNHLPTNSEDYQPTLKALELISEAADRANSEIKHFENLNKMLSIQWSLLEYPDPLVIPGRQFIKEGKLNKSAGKATHLKMFFLLSDMLIYANLMTGGTTYKFRGVLPIQGMKVFGQQFTQGSQAFHVISRKRSLTLFALNQAEKEEWVQALERAIDESRARKRSFRRRSTVSSVSEEWFGVHSPILLPCDSATRCMQCESHFGFRTRKNNCKGCGKVVCAHCLKYRIHLIYKGREDRVCGNCYRKAHSSGTDDVAPSRPASDYSPKKHASFEDKTVLEGHLLWHCEEEGTGWERSWVQIKKDQMIYKFSDVENVKSLDEIISLVDCSFQKASSTVITLSAAQRSYKLKMANTAELQKWLLSLSQVKYVSNSFSLSL